MLAGLLLLAAAVAEPSRTLVLVLDAVPYAAVAGEGLFADMGTPVPVVGTFGPVEGRVASRTFGQPVGLAGPPRTMQLGVRLGF